MTEQIIFSRQASMHEKLGQIVHKTATERQTHLREILKQAHAQIVKQT